MIDSFWGNIFRQEGEEENIRSILRKIPIFEGLSRKELAAVERILNHRQYKNGETIFRHDDPAGGMYIIIKGKVQVVFEPTQQVIAELYDGNFFGELALIDESPRSATVIAKMDSKILGFFQSDFLDLIDRNPKLGVKIAMRLLTVIGARLNKSNEQVQALQLKLYNLQQKRRRSKSESS